MDKDYPAGPEINEPLPEWSNWSGSESPTLEIDVYVWHYALMVVQARNERMNEPTVSQHWATNACKALTTHHVRKKNLQYSRHNLTNLDIISKF